MKNMLKKFNFYNYLIFLFLLLFIPNQINTQTIGIDIGSEFFKISLILSQRNQFRMIENLHSKTKTNTGIYIKNTDRIFENELLDKMIKDSKSTLTFINNYLGEEYNSSFINNYSKKYFQVYDLENNTYRNTINFKLKYMVKKNTTYTSIPIESLFGMIFRYIKKISEIYYKQNTGSKRDIRIEYCYVTVPSFYNYKQKLSIINAVYLSNMNLLGIISDNSAAALFYYIKNLYSFDNNNKFYIYFNIGSSYTQLSLILYNKNYTENIADISDRDLGGNTFTRNLVLKIIEKINKQNKTPLKIDYKLYNRIYSQANKYKEILSANKEVQFNIIIDYKKYTDIITREEFELVNKNEIDKIPILFNNLFGLVKNKKITLNNITSIELIGGTVRIPKIQNTLKEYIGEENEKLIGTHLNGDDSISNGASSLHKNKDLLKGEGNRYPIYLDVQNINKTKYLLNKTLLFKERTSYKTTNKINIIYDNDIIVNLYENNKTLFSYIISGTNKSKINIGLLYNNTNIDEKKIPIKISLDFLFDYVGVIHLRSEVIYTIKYYYKLNSSETNESLINYNNSNFIYTVNPVEAISKEEKDKINLILNNTKLNLTYKERYFYMNKLMIGNENLKDFNEKLNIKFIDNFPKIMNKSEIYYWKDKLDSYDQYEKDQIVILEKKNIIETILYTKKSYFNDKENNYRNFGNKKEIKNALNSLNAISNWYDEEGSSVTNLTLLNEKIIELNDTFEKFDKRKEIYNKREIALEKFNVFLKNIDKNYNKIKKEKPWLEYEYDNFKNSIIEIINWVNLKEEEQSKIKLYEEPIVSDIEIDDKRNQIEKLYNDFINIPKPKYKKKKNPRIENYLDDNWFDFF